MEKNRAIPQGYMTIGELAKKMGTTVRTLQYYDKEGLLSPSAQSEGGRRLYAKEDIFKLHQILAMKYLDFSLDEIKDRLANLDTPLKVAEVLDQQAEATREKIATLTEVLDVIEKLKVEVLQIKTVDFKRYADIIINLQMNNELYGLVKHMDEKILDHFRMRFDRDSAEEIINTLNAVCDKTEELKKNGLTPESEQGQAIGREWWDMVQDFTGGDVSLLSELASFAEEEEGWDPLWQGRWDSVQGYLQEAMIAYFTNSGINPFEGAQPK